MAPLSHSHAALVRDLTAPLDSNQQVNFSQRLINATEYFADFDFQSYRIFGDKRGRRRAMYQQGLAKFLNDLQPMAKKFLRQPQSPWPAPGENKQLDGIYALALTSHYISPHGQAALAVRDRFEPVSILQLLIAGLIEDRHFSDELHQLVEKKRDLALFFLQARFVAANHLIVHQVYGLEESLLALNSPWTMDLTSMAESENLDRLELLLQSVVEVREVLDLFGQRVPQIFIKNIGLQPVSTGEIFAGVDLSRLNSRYSPVPSHSLFRLTSLFEALKRPLL